MYAMHRVVQELKSMTHYTLELNVPKTNHATTCCKCWQVQVCLSRIALCRSCMLGKLCGGRGNSVERLDRTSCASSNARHVSGLVAESPGQCSSSMSTCTTCTEGTQAVADV